MREQPKIKKGDIIIKINNIPINDGNEQFLNIIKETKINEEIRFTYIRVNSIDNNAEDSIDNDAEDSIDMNKLENNDVSKLIKDCRNIIADNKQKKESILDYKKELRNIENELEENKNKLELYIEKSIIDNFKINIGTIIINDILSKDELNEIDNPDNTDNPDIIKHLINKVRKILNNKIELIKNKMKINNSIKLLTNLKEEIKEDTFLIQQIKAANDAKKKTDSKDTEDTEEITKELETKKMHRKYEK